jgi:hypothetical protein
LAHDKSRGPRSTKTNLRSEASLSPEYCTNRNNSRPIMLLPYAATGATAVAELLAPNGLALFSDCGGLGDPRILGSEPCIFDGSPPSSLAAGILLKLPIIAVFLPRSVAPRCFAILLPPTELAFPNSLGALPCAPMPDAPGQTFSHNLLSTMVATWSTLSLNERCVAISL